MANQYFLGVDIGTTAIKAALFDENGHKLYHHIEEYELIKPDSQRVEQTPERYWSAFKDSVLNAIRESGVNPQEIKLSPWILLPKRLFFWMKPCGLWITFTSGWTAAR